MFGEESCCAVYHELQWLKSWKNHNTVQMFSHIPRLATVKRDNEWIISCSFTTQNLPIFWTFPILLPCKNKSSFTVYKNICICLSSLSEPEQQAMWKKNRIITKVYLVSEEQFTGFQTFSAPVVTLLRVVAKAASQVGSTSH